MHVVTFNMGGGVVLTSGHGLNTEYLEVMGYPTAKKNAIFLLT